MTENVRIEGYDFSSANLISDFADAAQRFASICTHESIEPNANLNNISIVVGGVEVVITVTKRKISDN